MPFDLMRTARAGVAVPLAVLVTACASRMASQPAPGAASAKPAPAAPATDVRPLVRTLIVGGGPNPRNNQVAIESNVRYVGRLLPESSSYRVLFTDGRRDSPNVQFRAPNRTLAYRAPDLPRSVARAHALEVSGDEPTKRRFAELLLAEQRNPLR